MAHTHTHTLSLTLTLTLTLAAQVLAKSSEELSKQRTAKLGRNVVSSE